MDWFTGVLEFEYKGEIKRIPYSMTFLAGYPNISIEDKQGRNYPFFYRVSEKKWFSGLNGKCRWPSDFKRQLIEAFEKARIKHGL